MNSEKIHVEISASTLQSAVIKAVVNKQLREKLSTSVEEFVQQTLQTVLTAHEIRKLFIDYAYEHVQAKTSKILVDIYKVP